MTISSGLKGTFPRLSTSRINGSCAFAESTFTLGVDSISAFPFRVRWSFETGVAGAAPGTGEKLRRNALQSAYIHGTEKNGDAGDSLRVLEKPAGRFATPRDARQRMHRVCTRPALAKAMPMRVSVVPVRIRRLTRRHGARCCHPLKQGPRSPTAPDLRAVRD